MLCFFLYQALSALSTLSRSFALSFLFSLHLSLHNTAHTSEFSQFSLSLFSHFLFVLLCFHLSSKQRRSTRSRRAGASWPGPHGAPVLPQIPQAAPNSPKQSSVGILKFKDCRHSEDCCRVPGLLVSLCLPSSLFGSRRLYCFFQMPLTVWGLRWCNCKRLRAASAAGPAQSMHYVHRGVPVKRVGCTTYAYQADGRRL